MPKRAAKLERFPALAAEGSIRGRVGSGTRVLRAPPETYLRYLAEPYVTAYRGDLRRLLRDARFPSRIIVFADPDRNPLMLFR